MKILVLNAGSSSIKYRLFEMEDESALAWGVVERIGEKNGEERHELSVPDQPHRQETNSRDFADHGAGLERIFDVLGADPALGGAEALGGIGHRVVHGGERFRAPVVVDEDVMQGIHDVTPLAPLHNPANLEGIEVARSLAPTVPQVAVFDTAFHQGMPAYAYRYALPNRLYTRHGLRRYGFHGTSHQYVAEQAATHLGRPLEEINLITLHLGNGASAAAIAGGVSVDTSMGMTPLEGLVMGTRCGDLDPAVPFFIRRVSARSLREVEAMLNSESGLRGLCGVSDMREVHRLAAEGHADAALALEVFTYRIKKYVGAYLAVLGHTDALIFTGGIGENDSTVRALVCEGLQGLGLTLDPTRNASAGGDAIVEVQSAAAPMRILVIPTNEELEIARQVVHTLGADRTSSGPRSP